MSHSDQDQKQTESDRLDNQGLCVLCSQISLAVWSGLIQRLTSYMLPRRNDPRLSHTFRSQTQMIAQNTHAIYSMNMFFIWPHVPLNCRGLRRVCSLMKRRPSRQTRRRKQSWYMFAIIRAIYPQFSLGNHFCVCFCVCDRGSSLSIMKTGVKHLWIKAAQCSVCWTSKAVTSPCWKEYPPTSPQDRYTLCVCVWNICFK